MTDVERTAAGLQIVIPGCERRTLPNSVSLADEHGQGLLPFYQSPSLRETLTHRADSPMRSRRAQKTPPRGGLFALG